ncbi:trihelix transcription factor ENAP2 [Gastrolobium bilobum]|uniref:trihelix transcription factor ENAP2 n=1 Tax=Gastrolobium bilobum TaxID=150636 RepID=UPI002AAF2405|nr:trihelix transcription factor ENAP2 [Gastrolobium bilobum]
MATPSSPKLISPIATNDDASPPKRPQSIPWTHQETVNLIRSYQEKWYSLKRGPLRSTQWEEVAVVVAARCGYDSNHASKSAIQCRHKMEKLRQRHRAEKHRLSTGAAMARGGAWQYSGLMDELERGPLPISARPFMSMAPLGYNNENDHDEDDEDNDDDDDDDGVCYYNDDDDQRESYIKSKSINYIVKQRPKANKYGGVLGFSRERDCDDYDDEDEDEDDDDSDDEEGVVVRRKGLISGLSAELRGFAERFIGMENLKMEMMKETQRCRLEMEKKRIQMILESQRRIVDSIGRAFGSSKRMKISQQI